MPESGNTGNDLGDLVKQPSESYSKPSVLIVAPPTERQPIVDELERYGLKPGKFGTPPKPGEYHMAPDSEKARPIASNYDIAITGAFSISLRVKNSVSPDAPDFKDKLRKILNSRGLYLDNVVEAEAEPTKEPETKQVKILYVRNTGQQSRSIEQGLKERGYGVVSKNFMIDVIYGIEGGGKEKYEGTDLVLVTRDHGSYEGIQATFLLQTLAQCLPGVPVIYQTEHEGALVEQVVEFAGRYNNYKVLVGQTDTSDIFWQIEELLKQREAEEAQLPIRGEVARKTFEELGEIASDSEDPAAATTRFMVEFDRSQRELAQRTKPEKAQQPDT